MQEACGDIGETLAPPRIYLTGRISIENGSTLVAERELSGRQGRLAFAFLVAERHRPVSKECLVEVVWPESSPREPDTALSAILSKIRSVLKKAGLTAAAVDVLSGTVHLRLPADAWIDIEYAANALDEAEGALRTGDAKRAWGHAVALAIIARRPFLAGEDGPWIESRRAKLQGLLGRGLYLLSQISVLNDEPALALQYAGEVVEAQPFQETGYRHLMQLHACMGNRAEALRVFGKCRKLFRDELGASPSQQTEQVFLDILRADRREEPS